MFHLFGLRSECEFFLNGPTFATFYFFLGRFFCMVVHVDLERVSYASKYWWQNWAILILFQASGGINGRLRSEELSKDECDLHRRRDLKLSFKYEQLHDRVR